MNMTTSHSSELPAEVDLAKLVESKGHSLVFQPIFVPKSDTNDTGDADDNGVEILKYEALVRFPGLDTETTIIELEKDRAAIMVLTRNLIHETVDFLAKTKKTIGAASPPIAINLPPQLLESWQALPDELRLLLQRNNLQGEDVQFEITERGILDLEREKLRRFCKRLKPLGVIVMKDDFDDSSSLSDESVKQNTLDRVESSGIKGLKISAAFLLGKKPGNPDEVIAYAKANGLCLVVEQVRDTAIKEAVLQKLRAKDFPKNKIGLQGYALSKPLTPDALVADLRQRKFKEQSQGKIRQAA